MRVGSISSGPDDYSPQQLVFDFHNFIGGDCRDTLASSPQSHHSHNKSAHNHPADYRHFCAHTTGLYDQWCRDMGNCLDSWPRNPEWRAVWFERL